MIHHVLGQHRGEMFNASHQRQFHRLWQTVKAVIKDKSGPGTEQLNRQIGIPKGIIQLFMQSGM